MRSLIRPFALRLGGSVVVVLCLVPLLAPVPAGAQATPAATGAMPAGITVTGYGEASAPATSAQLQILITRGNPSPPQAPFLPPGATPGASEQAAAAPVVTAVAASGISRNSITVVISPVTSNVSGPGGPPVARVDFTLKPLTAEGLRSILASTIVAAASEGLTIGAVGVNYQANDCTALDREARAAAFKDAQTRAQNQAAALGVKLGPAIASVDQPLGSLPVSTIYGLASQGNGCAPPQPTASRGSPYPLGITSLPYDPAQSPEVDVYAQIAVTFAIEK